MVVHRDLKPSNILVTPDGRVKLLDFGISRQLDAIDRAATATIAAMRLLTPAYAAPEQIRGEATTVQTDVYALGVILYELLAGRTPFDLARLPPEEAERTLLEGERARRWSRQGIAGDRLVGCGVERPRRRLPRRAQGPGAPLPIGRGRYAVSINIWRANRSSASDTIGYRARKFLRRHWRPAWRLRPRSFSRSRSSRSTRSGSLWPEMRVAEALPHRSHSAFHARLFDGGEKDADLPTTFAW